MNLSLQRRKTYHKLDVWKLSHDLALAVYKATEKFPSHEKFELTSQLRRAALSVPTNIVEGQARRSRTEFLRFLDIAKASLVETEYLLEFSKDVGYLSEESYLVLDHQRGEVGFVLHRFINSLTKPN